MSLCSSHSSIYLLNYKTVIPKDSECSSRGIFSLRNLILIYWSLQEYIWLRWNMLRGKRARMGHPSPHIIKRIGQFYIKQHGEHAVRKLSKHLLSTYKKL